MSEKIILKKSDFCIPVTKAEPINAIQFIIDDFKKKKITFIVDGEGDHWEIWRIAEESDNDKIKKKGSPGKPKFLYVDGEEVLESDYVIED
jgi:hypothetical protein